MAKNLFDPHISPACRYCAHGECSSDGKNILCPKRGVVTSEYYCRYFQYEPLKREPKKPVRQTFQKEDFRL